MTRVTRGTAVAIACVAITLAVPASAASGIGVLAGARATADAGRTAVVSSPAAPRASGAAATPLKGKVVVVDAGHQLGNSRFPKPIDRPVDAGGFTKPCNTTGTSTNAGYAEATFAWQVARRVRDGLTALGATVVLTRPKNSYDLWGPCVDVRGLIGNQGYQGRAKAADLKLSIHGDGAAASAHGFHAIVATKAPAKTASLRYAKLTIAALVQGGFAKSTYIGQGTALSVRGDLGTLNRSAIPTVMVELGNMRNRGDAAVMSSAKGQDRYAAALVAAMRTDLTK